MRVLLAARFHESGQTTHVVELAKALQRLGHAVEVAALRRSHPRALAAYGEELSRAGIPCRPAPAYAAFRSVVDSFAPDVVHGHSSTAVPFLLKARLERGAPFVVTCHGLGVPARCPNVALADRCIAVGPNVARELERHGIRPLVIQNGVDTERFCPGPKSEKLTVAYVGRIDGAKRRGLEELVRAVRRIPEARLLVASNERPRGAGDAALGWVHDVPRLLATSHFVCGTGRAVREGMASGCIALVLGVAYGGPVTPERFEGAAFPSFSGLEGAPPRAEAIRADIVRLAQDPAARTALSAWSREYACSRFPISRMAEEVLAAYEDALRGRRR